MESRERRYPLLAAALSLAAPGLGQIYNGQVRRGAVFLALSLALGLANAVLNPVTATSFSAFVAQAVIVVSWILVAVLSIIGAYRSARRVGAIEPRRYNSWPVYLAIIIVANAGSFVVGETPYDTFSVPARSMLPTLEVGDRVVAAKLPDGGDLPERGDIVVFDKPGDPGNLYLKRIVGLPGDRIQMERGVLHINGDAVPHRIVGDITVEAGFPKQATVYQETLPEGRSYEIVNLEDGTPLDDTPEFEVPPDHVFVLGDNRDESVDSREPELSFVRADNLRARPTFIVWSRDLSRIGLEVR